MPVSRRATLLLLCLLSWPVVARTEVIGDDVPLPEVAAYVQARSAFERHCFRCHTSGGDAANKKSLALLDMSQYPFSGRKGALAGRTVRRVLGGGGGKATMPKDDPGSLDAADLAAILAWADKFDALHDDR